MHVISSLEVGGAQAVLYDLVLHFHKKGYTQIIVFFHDGPYRKRLESLSVATHHVRGMFAPIDPVSFFRLMQLVRTYRPDVVHTILWAANVLGRCVSRMFSIYCVASLHNNYDQNGVVRSAIDRMVSYRTTQIVAVSDEVKRSFTRLYASASVTVIPNGIDINRVREMADAQQKTREDLNLSSEHFIIGSVGRFHPIKQYPLLLKAFALVHKEYPHARLLLIGYGTQEHYLRECAHSLQITPYIRWIIGQQAYGYYRLLDCFVLASSKEGISIALLEAMSLGVFPVTAYHIAQHPVVDHGQNGSVAKSNNATDLARKIGSIAGGRSAREVRQKNAQRIVRERFAVSGMIAAYDRMFRAYSDVKVW